MVTRHSKQVPIPHKGARASPLTDIRNVLAPDDKIATATVVPSATEISFPSMLSVINVR
jgi:hypothetical protein